MVVARAAWAQPAPIQVVVAAVAAPVEVVVEVVVAAPAEVVVAAPAVVAVGTQAAVVARAARAQPAPALVVAVPAGRPQLALGLGAEVQRVRAQTPV